VNAQNQWPSPDHDAADGMSRADATHGMPGLVKEDPDRKADDKPNKSRCFYNYHGRMSTIGANHNEQKSANLKDRHQRYPRTGAETDIERNRAERGA
jgi:hypothetical protein